MRRFYGSGLPGVDPADLTGPFVVVEGQDGAGRSTHVRLLQDWLEEQGHAVTTVGLRRSALIARELSNAKQGHMLGRKTMSLFYATDLADQLEHQIIPRPARPATWWSPTATSIRSWRGTWCGDWTRNGAKGFTAWRPSRTRCSISA